jgi:hypothetical protein
VIRSTLGASSADIWEVRIRAQRTESDETLDGILFPSSSFGVPSKPSAYHVFGSSVSM